MQPDEHSSTDCVSTSYSTFVLYLVGDYIKMYEKKRAIRKFIFVVVITGIVVSIIAGVIVNKFGWGL
jgi:hypothetical protein